ncbi:hypothetical protein BDU57DRAFT_519869 [Ampelomyces quisqualis]|uniref:Uncharacterized protein n=1 Tax=Ampelomyces quisqualis TaxID=50730 RepID=A0A6A5QGS8_AMPQU|nr:hypothetical protein BDU57DRAFT_519869 [Ampelomyces quisqualis]
MLYHKGEHWRLMGISLGLVAFFTVPPSVHNLVEVFRDRGRSARSANHAFPHRGSETAEWSSPQVW